MDLKGLQHKKILLLGKSRSFSSSEFDMQLKNHKISLAEEFDKDVSFVILGRMMTPNEQNFSDKLYEDGFRDFVSIDEFELELTKYLDADTLLMSLKLGKNRERVKSFIKNPMIEDALFFRLLKMHSWGGEDFFENDDNRDVSAAIILRFYENIERNHNVQYATSGLLHLISQTQNSILIENIATLEPLQKTLLNGLNGSNMSILCAIAMHEKTPKSVLKLFAKSQNFKVNAFVAMRDDCDEEMQELLFDLNQNDIFESLSKNSNLSKKSVFRFLELGMYEENMAKNIKLDSEFFELFLEKNPLFLAKNISLSLQMQLVLSDMQDEMLNISLAQNPAIHEEVIQKLLRNASLELKKTIYKNPSMSTLLLKEAFLDKNNYPSLACNENTPQELLLELSCSLDEEVLGGLAKNRKTPVEVLYQLQLDARFARAVKENPSFGREIQIQSIGWQV